MLNLEILDFFKKTMLENEIKFKEVDKSDIKFLDS